MFSFNWLVIIWRGEGKEGGGMYYLKKDVQGQGGGRILVVDGHFSWTSFQDWIISY